MRDGSTRDLGLEALFIAIGHQPNVLFKGQLAMDDVEYLKVEPGSTYVRRGRVRVRRRRGPGLSAGGNGSGHGMHGGDRRGALVAEQNRLILLRDETETTSYDASREHFES